MQCVTMSGNPEKDVREWFENGFPAFDKTYGDEMLAALYENVCVQLCFMAVLLRPIMKMSRWGVGLRLLAIALLCLADVVSDFAVSRSLWDSGEKGWAILTLSYVVAAISFQTLMVIIQYHRCGWRKLATKVVLALLCLLPRVQAVEVWTGATDTEDDCTFPPVVMLGLLKMCEALFESLPGESYRLPPSFR